MRWVVRKMFCGLFLLVCFNSVQANMLPLNVADVPVGSHSAAALRQALPKALEQVLVKMSGNASVMTVPAVQAASENVNQLIEKYRYSESSQPDGSAQLLLHVAFDEQALKRILRDTGQAIWLGKRPLTLVWVVAPETGEAAVLLGADQSELAASLKARAAARGIPMMFPVMDLTDQPNTSVQWVMPSDQALAALAERYHVGSVLVGVMQPRAGRHEQMQWQWVLNGTAVQWQNAADNATQAVVGGLDKMADLMANRYATANIGHLQTHVLLQVTGVEDLNDYARIVSALGHLSQVSQVRVAGMENNLLRLNLEVSGEKNRLVSALNSINHLKPELGNDSMGEPADFSYRWDA